MKRPLLTLASAILAVIALNAQDARTLILEDYTRMGANYHVYEPGAGELTAAPQGYEPFYISHYGRHGSRYITFETSHKYVISHLKALRDAGLLNEWGDELLATVSETYAASRKRLGRLSPLGVQEHRQIAARMYERFPGVFAPGTKIDAVSSTSRRCKTSMVQFLAALSEKESSLDLNIDTSPANMNYINNKGGEPHKAEIKALMDSIMKATLNPEAIIGPVTTDCKAAMKLLHHPEKFERLFYDCAAICQCMPEGYDLLPFIPFEEGFKLWSVKNKQQYFYHAASVPFGSERVKASRPLAEDFVYKADAAIKEGKPAADLRFGHDSGLIAFQSYVGIEGFDKQLALNETDEWQNFRLMCMASNIQFIFYRNTAGKILVQVLQNEKEVSVPALGPGPFYPWEELRTQILEGQDFLRSVRRR